MSILELMGAPFAECLILVAILKRRVIFVDLALAQIAALGTTVGFLFGIMPDTKAALLFSMAFTFLGAAVFTVTRFRHERVPQEAVIGLAYAVSCAVAVLVIEKTRGAEHLKDILVGNLLWVRWSVGLVHFAFRSRFLAISNDPERAYRAGIAVRAWDFLFYLTFGIVITVSTRVAGVLLVFVFLVAPAILAFLITTRLTRQLLIGWGTGTLVTVVGLYLSWVLDLPSGPAVIAFYAFALVLGGVIIFLSRARRAALRPLSLGAAATLLIGAALWWGGRWLGTTEWAVSQAAHAAGGRAAPGPQKPARRPHPALRGRRKARVAPRRNRARGADRARAPGPRGQPAPRRGVPAAPARRRGPAPALSRGGRHSPRAGDRQGLRLRPGA
jgi:zinc/manganese transport system permease protein